MAEVEIASEGGVRRLGLDDLRGLELDRDGVQLLDHAGEDMAATAVVKRLTGAFWVLKAPDAPARLDASRAAELAMQVLGAREFNRLTPGRWLAVGVARQDGRAVAFKAFESDQGRERRNARARLDPAAGRQELVLAFMTP